MDFEYIQLLMPAMMRGLTETVKLFVLTLVFALPLGLPFALGSISRFSPVKWLSKGYIWLFRGTPLMLQLYFVCYGLPAFGITLDRFPCAVLTFALNYAAYFAEIYRAGIQSIDKGQYEAAKGLGFSPWQTMRIIIIPQTIKRILPPVANETITLVKDTALATAIALPELLKAAKDAANRDVRPDAFFVAAVFYLLLTALLTYILTRVEKRFSRHERQEA